MAQLLLQVHHQHLGQSLPVVACFQLKQPDLALLCLIHGLHRRGSRAQHQQGPILNTAVFGHIPGVVAGDVFRFVTALLLLVQNDETQIVQGGEDSRAGANHHRGLPTAGPLPLVVPLPRAQRAVEHRNLSAEVGGKDPQQLGGEDDLGHQHQGGASPGQGLLNQADVDLGLAAARHTVEQGGGGLPLSGQGVQPLKGRLLLFIEHRGLRRGHVLQGNPAQHLLLLQREDAAFFQGFQGGGGGPSEVAQVLHRCGAQGAQQLGHGVPQGGGLPSGGHHGHGVLRRDSQHRQFLLLIPHRPLSGGLQGGHPGLGEPADGGVGVSGPEGQAYLLHIPLAAPAPKQVQQLDGGGGALGGPVGPLPVHPRPDGHLVPQGEIQPRGQHGLYTVVNGAEAAFPHPQGQLDGSGVQHRLVVQHRLNQLQRLPRRGGLIQGEHQPVRPPVARGEGHQHPHPGLQPPLQLQGHQVVIGFVNGVHRPGDGHLCDFSAQGPSPPFCPLPRENGHDKSQPYKISV